MEKRRVGCNGESVAKFQGAWSGVRPGGARALIFLLVGVMLALAPAAPAVWSNGRGAATIPPREGAPIDERAFWRMVSDFSEEDGRFHSDNLVSNEREYQVVIPQLKVNVGVGRAYLGVGPDQNFAYIAALQPSVAFIVDIRRQNALLHLLYKAVFEDSETREEFLARLFSRPKPSGLDRRATAGELLAAFDRLAPDPKLHERNHRDVLKRLVDKHRFVLGAEDLRLLRYVHDAFYQTGPDISYAYPTPAAQRFPSWGDLVLATDGEGINHGYIGSDEIYQVLRRFQLENRLIPVVGDFAGDKALPSVAAYLQARGLKVGAFYTSNVEFYLYQTERWRTFFGHVGLLPVDQASQFIRSSFGTSGYGYGNFGGYQRMVVSRTLLDSISGLVNAFRDSRVETYEQLLDRSR